MSEASMSGTEGVRPDTAAQPDVVQSLVRGLAVIRAFDAEHPLLTLSEVARRTGVPAAAARRFLQTLESLGYVRHRVVGTKRFELTPKVLELGFGYLSALSLPEIMQPHLEALSQQTGESVSAAVLSGPDIVYVARVPTRRIMSVRITIGTSFPAYATSMGRVLLASLTESELEDALAATDFERLTAATLTEAAALRDELARVRQQGWCIVDGELEAGLRSVSVPVRGRDGSIPVALNVSTSATRDSIDDIRTQHLPLALEAARAIEAELRLY